MDIKQGTIGWVDFSPTKGHEQTGRRPALIVSDDLFNQSCGGIVWAIPITSTTSGFCKLTVPKGLPVSGAFILSQIKAIDITARSFTPICEIPDELLAEGLRVKDLQLWFATLDEFGVRDSGYDPSFSPAAFDPFTYYEITNLFGYEADTLEKKMLVLVFCHNCLLLYYEYHTISTIFLQVYPS